MKEVWSSPEGEKVKHSNIEFQALHSGLAPVLESYHSAILNGGQFLI